MSPIVTDDQFASTIATWQQLRKDMPQEAESYYCEHILGTVYQRFAATIKPQLREHVRALILVGSGQPDTAALLIAGLNPERVAFLLTSTTRTFRKRVYERLVSLGLAEQLACPYAAWLPLGDAPQREDSSDYIDLHSDHASVLNTYRGLKLVLQEWHDLPTESVAIDLTAGKSTMTVGLTKAAHILGIGSIYIDSDYDERNQIIQGSQRLVITEDPYTVFGDLEAREAQKLYLAHDYQGAQRMFDALARRVHGQEGLLFRAYAALSDAYAAWDSFDLPGAERILDALLATGLPGIPEGLHSRLIAQAESLTKINALGRQLHGRSGPPLAALDDRSFILALFGSLYANAMRREQQGRLDVAALLLYRCLELMSQHRLAGYGVITEQADMQALRGRHPDLDQRYRAVESRIGFTPRGLPRSDGITLFNGYMLLAALGDSLTNGIDLRYIQAQVRVRNTSILAHGYRLITKTEYMPFKQLVDDLRQRFFSLLHVNIDAWEEQYRFVPL